MWWKLIHEPGKSHSIGETPLAHAAGFYPYPELVDFLLKQGADVNAVNQYGDSIVAYCRNPNILKKLLRHGAKVNTADRDGRTPMHETADDDENGIERMKLLLGRGAKIDAVDHDGNQPLHVAPPCSDLWRMSNSSYRVARTFMPETRLATHLQTKPCASGRLTSA